jgi:hypothetical protein
MIEYPQEVLDEDSDNGTMPANVETLAEAVIGHRIVSAVEDSYQAPWYVGSKNMETKRGLVVTLDNGTQVRLSDESDCCAYTDLEAFLLHPDKVDHVIMGVGTTDEYTRWHIYADMGDVLELTVGWSCGNPFYYGYGFTIDVVPA